MPNGSTIIDLRSDTVTQPTPAMRKAMAQAEVGDDVYGEDPSIRQLEALAAERSGKEAALYTSSGTQANLLSLLTHCQRGDEYIVGQQAHNYKYEGGGAAVFGSIQPQPITHAADGSLPRETIEHAIKTDDFHFARTRLISVENTIGGKVLSLEYMQDIANLAKERGLAYHLDGARVYNAAVALGCELERIARLFDSLTICLSKGLGAPVGSVICGNHDFIANCRRWRKVAGGGMRQAGILAAAGSIALQEGPEHLAEDHHKAATLGAALHGLGLKPEVNTNMIFVDFPPECLAKLCTIAKESGLAILPEGRLRLVLHRDIDHEDIPKVSRIFEQALDSSL